MLPLCLLITFLAQDILPARLVGAVALAPPGAGCAGAGELLPGAVLGAGEPGQGPSLVTQTRTETLPGDVTVMCYSLYPQHTTLSSLWNGLKHNFRTMTGSMLTRLRSTRWPASPEQRWAWLSQVSSPWTCSNLPRQEQRLELSSPGSSPTSSPCPNRPQGKKKDLDQGLNLKSHGPPNHQDNKNVNKSF